MINIVSTKAISPEKIIELSVCLLIQLQRHGARFPTAKGGVSIDAVLAKLKAVHNITDPLLQFVPGFTLPFKAEQLVPFGRNQSVSSIAHAYIPFIPLFL
jgi:hypothetical protein